MVEYGYKLLTREECKSLLEFAIKRKLESVERFLELAQLYKDELPNRNSVIKIYEEKVREYLGKNIKDLVSLIAKYAALEIYELAKCYEDEYGRIVITYEKVSTELWYARQKQPK